jgi:hypothetical protein
VVGSHPRSVKEFVLEVMDVTDEEVLAIRWDFRAGMYLEDLTTGNTYRLGWINRWAMLSPALQESICRALNRTDLLVLLGLTPPD